MNSKNSFQVINLGRQPYRPAWRYQKELHTRRHDGDIPHTLVFVEHEPVYTLGKGADRSHITMEPEVRERQNIDVVEIGRGGDVTYHGPGQLVGYPIFDLRKMKKDVRWYVRSLEEVIIQTLDHHGREVTRRDGYPGVWVGKDKVCAIGVRIARWVTLHGFALNIRPNFRHFDGIVPCGITDGGVTSLGRLLDESPSLSEVMTTVVTCIRDVFGLPEPSWRETEIPAPEKEHDLLLD